MRVFTLYFIAIFLSEIALAGERTNEVILQKLSDDLISSYKSKFIKITDKPSVFIAEVKNNAKSLSEDDLQIILNKIESSISDFAVLLDRDKTPIVSSEQILQQSGSVADDSVQNIGEKIGATQVLILEFNDKIMRIGEDLDKVTINGKLTAIEIKNQRKILTKLAVITYQRETFRQSYYLRDTASFTFYTLGIISGAGALGLLYKATSERDKYNKANRDTDAAKYRKSTQQSTSLAYIAGGVSFLTLGLGWWIDSRPKDHTEYYEFELSLVPSLELGTPSMGVAWNF